jgi:FkbM family methyltransferase
MERSLIFDVGCNKGQDSEFYLKKGFRVLAVEANPILCSELRRHFSDQLADGSFVLVEGAIAEREGKVDFFSNVKVSEWGTTSAEWARKFEHLGAASTKIVVPAVTFASVLQRFGVPYYLKIDIAGADMLCLKDLLTVSDRPRFVSIESEKRSWFKLRAEMNLLRRLGYSKFQIVDQALVPSQTPPVPAREGNFANHRFERDSSGLFGEELPGPWLDRGRALARYRRIFLNYWLSGDFGILLRVRGLRRFARHFPVSWYDTHAALDV